MTPAPLPDWQDLAALAGPVPAGDEIAQPWRRTTERAFWFSRSAYALARLVEWRAKARPKPVLWLPDYFCNQSSLPARAAGAQVRFYPVGADLAIDWPGCRELAKKTTPDLFVLVHFFGRPMDASRAAEFCRETGAILVEDAAHVARPAGAIGTVGDFTFYSPHKILAVPDGGLLLARDAPSDFAAAAARPLDMSPSIAPWLVKRALQKIAPDALGRLHVRLATPAFTEDPYSDLIAPTAALSPIAARLIQRAATRLVFIAEERRRNELMLRRALAGHPGQPLFSDDWGDATPYRFAFRADTPEIAAHFYRLWRRHGVPVETWPDLALEVLGYPDVHAGAIGLRRTVLLLPVHRPVDPARLRLD